MPYYSDEIIEEVRSRNDIVDVISQYVRLQKKGSTYFGLCPFHNEKTGSFSVSPNKQMYYCFGCGAGGNVFTFIKEYENFTFGEAMEYLADRAGIELPKQEYSTAQRQEADRRAKLLEINKEAGKYFYTLLRSERGARALQYFRKRELSDETMKKFGLGYSDQYSDDLYRYLRSKGYEDELLQESGLVTIDERRGGHDKFWNRAMFPIMDVHNKVIGFGGRVMGEGEPKYLNSPETIIFNKRRKLFALNLAKKTKLGYMILVEGYMDAVALHQYGFDCAVASLGTSLTEEHAVLLSRYTDQVMLIYDGDDAGQNATRRAIPMLEKAGLQVKVLQMRDAKDPDEFLKKFGADKFRLLLEESSNRVEYQLRAIEKKYDLTQDEERVKFIAEAADFIASLPGAVQREIYGTRAAEAAGISQEAMKLETGKAYKRRLSKEKRKQEHIDLAPAIARQPKSRTIHYENVKSAMAEETVIALCLRDPGLIQETGDLTGDIFSSPLLGRVFDQLVHQSREGKEPTLTGLTDFTGEEMAHIAGILQRNTDPVSEQALNDSIRVIRDAHQFKSAGSDEDLRLLQQKLRESKGIRA